MQSSDADAPVEVVKHLNLYIMSESAQSNVRRERFSRKENDMIVLLAIIGIALLIYFGAIKPIKAINASGSNVRETSSQQQSTNQGMNTSGTSRTGHNNSQNYADVLISSPYYYKYKAAFTKIHNAENQERYKIDWLLQSLNSGHELDLDGAYVEKSIDKNLPYYCESKREYDMFFDVECPVMRGSIDGMRKLCFFYCESASNASAHAGKFGYWKRRICELARGGDVVAQGVLCLDDDISRSIFTPEERAVFKDLYKTKVEELSEAGNPYAQLARGKYLLPSGSSGAVEWLEKAANQGLSDAWCQLANSYIAKQNTDGVARPYFNKALMGITHDLDEKVINCYMNGAKADNGSLAAYCQKTVAGYYESGYGDIVKRDILKAVYWFEKAYRNGDEYSGNMLKYYNGHPELY